MPISSRLLCDHVAQKSSRITCWRYCSTSLFSPASLRTGGESGYRYANVEGAGVDDGALPCTWYVLSVGYPSFVQPVGIMANEATATTHSENLMGRVIHDLLAGSNQPVR